MICVGKVASERERLEEKATAFRNSAFEAPAIAATIMAPAAREIYFEKG